jgi:hypothetical protein
MNFSNLESEFAELRDRGYEIDSQLGCNRAAGRVTYKAIALSTNSLVVIKLSCYKP